MVTLASQSQLAKMTTAHTAGTVQAVLPISSVRNVMAKVDSSLEGSVHAIGKPRLGRKPKYKTCRCGFVGYGKSFPVSGKGLCLECYSNVVAARKSVWGETLFNAYRVLRQKHRRIELRGANPWLKWACQLKNCIRTTPKRRVFFPAKVESWDERFTRFLRKTYRKENTEWQRKCLRWEQGPRRRQPGRNY